MTRRYALEPLADAMGLSLNAACAQLGVSGSTQQEYRRRGVTARVADRLACKAGHHPAEIWHSWHQDAIEDAGIECAADDCDQQFIPTRKGHQYCSPACRRRHRYQTNRDERERRKAHSHHYYTENSEYARWRQRTYRARLRAARRHELRQNADQTTTQGAA